MRDTDAIRLLQRENERLQRNNDALVEHILHLTGKPRDYTAAEIARFEERERLVADLADPDQDL